MISKYKNMQNPLIGSKIEGSNNAFSSKSRTFSVVTLYVMLLIHTQTSKLATQEMNLTALFEEAKG